MATVNMSIRMDTKFLKKANAMLSDMGLNMTTAMNMFLRQVVRQGRIPFEIAPIFRIAKLWQQYKRLTICQVENPHKKIYKHGRTF